MKSALRSALALSVFTCATTLAQQADPVKLKEIASANALTSEGKTPFHLKVNFQLFDLAGKETESGTIEEWWTAPGIARLVVTSPSLSYIIPGQTPPEGVESTREGYLVNQLITQELDPVPDLSRAQIPLKTTNQSFDKLQLTCYVAGGTETAMNYCVDPSSNALRIKYEPGDLFEARNSLGTFHGTNVALDTRVSYEGKSAISGKIVALQSFDASKADMAMTHPEPVAAQPLPPGAKAGVMAGKIIDKVQPTYPMMAKSSHRGGTVILHALISKQGTIIGLFPIASPDASLTEAAMDAVKKWKYQPYLLNGQPTEVDTTIHVSFNLNGG